MKFRVEQAALADAVAWAARTVPTRPPVPIIAGIKLDVEDGSIHLSSFDYDVSARIEIPADVATEGSVVVSGRLFNEIARALPDRPVDATLNGTKLELTAGNAHFSMLTMPSSEYPALPQMPDVIGTIDAKAFSEAVSQVTVAASKDEVSPLLTGVRMEFNGDTISLLATDRYRLTLRDVVWNPTKTDIEQVALVRAKTLSDAAKTVSGTVDVGLSTGAANSLIGFEVEGKRTTSGLLDGDYPPVRKLFLDSAAITAVMNVEEITAAARRVALVAERNAPIRLSFSQGQVLLQAGAGDEAQASEETEALVSGDDIQVAFNPHYLIDGLSAINSEFVRLSFTQPAKPVEFTGQASLEGDDDKSFRYLLVPIRFAG